MGGVTRNVRSGAIGAVERERYYTVRVYWLDGAAWHSSGLFEHQGWRDSDWYGSTTALYTPASVGIIRFCRPVAAVAPIKRQLRVLRAQKARSIARKANSVVVHCCLPLLSVIILSPVTSRVNRAYQTLYF